MKKIEVLGMGCQRCSLLASRAKEAIEDLGVEVELVKVQDIEAIAKHGVLATPALVVNGVVKVAGKIPKVEEIKEWIK